MDNNVLYEEYLRVKDDLANKESVLRSYNGVQNAPISLVSSIKRLKKQVLVLEHKMGRIDDDTFDRLYESADDLYSQIVPPESSYQKNDSLRVERKRPLIEPDIMQEAMRLHYTPERLFDDEKLVLESVKTNSTMLEFASERLKDDFEIVKAAVNHDGLALKFASERLRDDPEIVREAVMQNPKSLEYASERIRNNPSVLENKQDEDKNLMNVSEQDLHNNQDKDYQVFLNDLMANNEFKLLVIENRMRELFNEMHQLLSDFQNEVLSYKEDAVQHHKK